MTSTDLDYSRSIPAPAGEPRSAAMRINRARVYPRACGGTNRWSNILLILLGLSPRLRGNLLGRLGRRQRYGSIPAPAGEPSSTLSSCSAERVYPRACGGTTLADLETTVTEGLSPRLRGNQAADLGEHLVYGSIPAPAGEPLWLGSTSGTKRVYPRACGGTA